MKITKQVLLDVEQMRLKQITKQSELDRLTLERSIRLMAEDWMFSKNKEDVYNNLIKIAATTVKMAEVYKRG